MGHLGNISGYRSCGISFFCQVAHRVAFSGLNCRLRMSSLETEEKGCLVTSSLMLEMFLIVKVKSLSSVRLCDAMVAYQAPPCMEFSRQEYLSGLPFPSPGDLPNPGIEPRSPALQADALTSEPPGKQSA